MKREKIVAVVLFVVGGFPLAVAQTPPMPTGVSPTVTQDGEATASVPPARRAPDEDARRCLEFPTNAQVIMCAEKYRLAKRHR